MLPITRKTITARHRLEVRTKDEYLESVLEGKSYLVFDGAMGTMLQKNGLDAGDLPELFCVTHPDVVTAIHRAYVEAGSHVATTNTFGANVLKLEGKASVEEVFEQAVACARNAGPRYIAADIGPTGALLEPLGTLSFDDAYDLFAQEVKAADKAGADLIIIETMTDLLEVKAAVLAAKENSDLPVFATMTFGEDGRTFLGTSPAVAAVTLESLGVNALGVNCSLGPDALAPLVATMMERTSCPIIVQANAGLPDIVDGNPVYSIAPEDYHCAVARIIDSGATIIGGCCGTNPSYIQLIAQDVSHRKPPVPRTIERASRLTSAQNIVELHGGEIAVIGERINPTGKKKLKEALREEDYDYVIDMALDQADAGADLLDVNAGLPEIDEAATLVELVKNIQSACPLPLQIDSSEPAAIEAAVRCYAGKPLINSVNGKADNLAAVLPIAAHYGCAVVGLTLDEQGIPPTAEGRFAIAERIVSEAARYGIPSEDVYIDCLTMAASTNQKKVVEILKALRLVKERLGVRTVLGVSNISFGLPAREVVNATFLAAALSAGLDLPILNPLNERFAETIDAWRLLSAEDEGATSFVEKYHAYLPLEKQRAQIRDAAIANQPMLAAPVSPAASAGEQTAPAGAHQPSGCAADPDAPAPTDEAARALMDAVIEGRKNAVAATTEQVIARHDPLFAINECLIPALDTVGERFESGVFFLPQLMASAEAAKAGFDIVRSHVAAESSANKDKGPVALATVKGDIHDIGKNIVKMLLENYGFKVFDLGRDVGPDAILNCIRAHEVKLVGLSALMTTTVHNMEDTIARIHREFPDTKVFVGGAVLNEEYAHLVGADYYTKDATASARLAEEFFKEG